MMTPQRRVVFDFEAPVRQRITQNPDLFDFALTPPSKIKHNLPLVALSSESGVEHADSDPLIQRG